MGRGWRKVGGGDHACHMNGILGLLIKEKFPGLVYTWAHYAAVPDTPDWDGRVFADKAQRVKAELR